MIASHEIVSSDESACNKTSDDIAAQNEGCKTEATLL